MRCTLTRLVAVALPMAAGCTSGTGPTTGAFRGIYINAFETSAFRPCSEGRAWWTNGQLGPVFAAWAAEGQTDAADAHAAYLVVRGRRSGKGEYGHLGSYEYELRVDEVLEVRTDTAGACR